MNVGVDVGVAVVGFLNIVTYRGRICVLRKYLRSFEKLKQVRKEVRKVDVG